MNGATLRDEGIALVMDNAAPWSHEVEAAFCFWLDEEAPGVFSLEQFRVWAEANGLPEPHHPNAWGGLAKRFNHKIEQVGFTQSARPQAHARLTRTYRRS